MWKWIVGVLLVVIILIGGTCYRTFKMVTSGGGTASVTVAGNAEHVFAALSNADSMQAWMSAGMMVTPLGRGPLKVGDSIQIARRGIGSDSSIGATAKIWVVREITPPTRIIFDAVGFTSVGAPYVEATRRDSVVAMGDSTMVFSSFTDVKLPNGMAAGADSGMSGVAQKLLLGTKRIEAEGTLRMLKNHFEKPKP
jgi:hypothetical protein